MDIYIIDDELIITRTFESFLGDLGHKVISFNTVSDFLGFQRKKNDSENLIIVDLNMPQDMAIKMVSKIHKKFPNTPILVMSSILPSEEAISNGVYSYLKKPISFAEIELILARVSEKYFNECPESVKEARKDNLKGGYKSDKRRPPSINAYL